MKCRCVMVPLVGLEVAVDDLELEEGIPAAMAFHGDRRGEVHGEGMVTTANEVAGEIRGAR